MTRRRPEHGTVTVLLVGFLLVLGLLTGAVVDASAAYLRHQELDSLADGAALAAADGAQGARVYEHGLGRSAQIDPAAAVGYVEQYLGSVGASGSYPGITWTVHSTGQSVTVELRAPLHLPLTPPGWDSTSTVTGRASAVVPVS